MSPAAEHVLDLEAAVLDEVDTRPAGDRAGLVAADAALEPQALGASRNRVAGDIGAKRGPAEDVTTSIGPGTSAREA